MHKLFLITAILLTLAITVGSLISIQSPVKINISNTDKFIHFSAYAVLTFNWLLVVVKKNSNLRKKITLVAFSILTYGIIIEISQGTLTYRQADYLDILANLVGIITSIIVFIKIFKKFQQN